MRIAIASRIFEPEASAASFRLAALADAFVDEGHDVTVFTVRPGHSGTGAGNRAVDDAQRRYSVRRTPVLRDRSGYVRGYVQYLSFDVPLLFRMLFGAKQDLIVAEPPPTTGLIVWLVARLRRIPYAYYAADIWSDAAKSTGAARIVVSAVRRMERKALSGARGILSVNEGVTARIQEMVPTARIHTVGNGIDTKVFTHKGNQRGEGRFIVYPGTASEWQGAEIFVQAMALLRERDPDLRLVFLGQGSAWEGLRQLAKSLNVPVDFIGAVPPAEAAAWLRGSCVSLASIRPGAGYDFAFPTKLFASWAAGTPTVFAGSGTANEVLASNPMLGVAANYEANAVAEAILEIVNRQDGVSNAKRLAEWADRNVSLAQVAKRAVASLLPGPVTDDTFGEGGAR